MTSFINYDTVVDLTSIASISEVPIYNANKIQGVEVTDDVPNNGDVIVYNSTSNKYELEQPIVVNPNSPIFNANRLQGIDLPAILPGPSVNDILVYNGSAYEYQAVLDPTDNIFNANQLQGKALPDEDPGPSINDTLVFNGLKYEYQPYLDPDSPDYNAKKIQDIEVTELNPENGQTLVYNSDTLKYELQATPNPADSIYNAKQLQGVEITTDTPGNGEALVYDSGTLKYELQEIVGVNTIQNLTNKSFEDSTTYFYNNLDITRRLQFDCFGIATGTTKTLTAPDTNDTIVVLSANQTLTNKTFTRPVITSESAPVGTTGMLYYDTVLNLLASFNGIFWQYLGMFKPIKKTILGFDFYAIPISTAMGGPTPLASITNDVNNAWATNGWTASSTGASPNQLVLTHASQVYSDISFSTNAQNNYIQYDFGNQEPGIYSIIFTCGSFTDSGILTVTEQTTGIQIIENDIYRNLSAVITFQLEYPFIFTGNSGASADLIVRWASNNKHSSSLGYQIRLANQIQLTRIG